MKVVVAPSAGFCRGVRNAVTRARECAKNTRHVHTDGPLIHNKQMMASLAQEGVAETDAPEALPSNSTLVIRAHGISPERRAFLRSLPLELVDATCPDVARIQSQIRLHARQGAAVLIYGDHGHAEVVGLLGFAEGRGRVVSSVEEVETLCCSGVAQRRLASRSDAATICLVAQSTQFPFAYAEVAEAVKQRFPNVVVLDTICDATKNRQREVEQLAAECDALVIVGGHHSANTLRLVELARTFKPTFHIETAAELRREDFSAFRCVGLTAGASTPDFLLDETRNMLEGF